jgi:hypothetical protein
MNCQILAKPIIFQRIIRRIGWGKNTLELVLRPTVMMVSRSWNVSNNALYLKSIQEINCL